MIDFQFKIDLKNLREIRYLHSQNYSMNSLYESIKDNSEKLSFYIQNNENNDFKKLIDIFMNVKFSVLDLDLDHSVLKPILNTKFKIDVETLKFNLHSNESDLILKNFLSKVYNLKCVTFETNVDKETLDILKEKKELKTLEMYNMTNFTSDELFDFLNHSKIENLVLNDEFIETTKEFFDLLKENISIKYLDINIWNESIYDMIIHNFTLETLIIKTDSIEDFNYNDTKRLFESLKNNSSIKELFIYPCNYI